MIVLPYIKKVKKLGGLSNWLDACSNNLMVSGFGTLTKKN
jgi:hypothetical protein